jgi:hypothetical protein
MYYCMLFKNPVTSLPIKVGIPKSPTTNYAVCVLSRYYKSSIQAANITIIYYRCVYNARLLPKFLITLSKADICMLH